MASQEITTRIPRRFSELNTLVERFGIKTTTRVLPENETEGPRVEIVWSGKTKSLRETGLMPPSWRMPLHGGDFLCPDRPSRVGLCLIAGRINEEGDHFRMIALESAPLTIGYLGSVEVLAHDDYIIYYGDREAMVNFGICADTQFPGPKRRTKTNHDMSGERVWFTRRTPWGPYIFASETDSRYRERLTESVAFLDRHYPRDPDRAGYRRALRALKFSEEGIGKARSDSAFRSFMGRLGQ